MPLGLWTRDFLDPMRLRLSSGGVLSTRAANINIDSLDLNRRSALHPADGLDQQQHSNAHQTGVGIFKKGIAAQAVI